MPRRRLRSSAGVGHGDPAVAAAKAVGKPVKLIYAREHDIRWISPTADLPKGPSRTRRAGKLWPWSTTSSLPGQPRIGASRLPVPGVDKKGELDPFAVQRRRYWYSVPNHTVRNFINKLAQGATPSGQLRSVAPGWTFWAVESMMDEVAHAVGKDPAAFRLAMLDGKGDNAGAPRLANALRAAVGLAGYGTIELPKGEAMGVACVSSQERKSRPGRPVRPCRGQRRGRNDGEETHRRLRRRHGGQSRRHPRADDGRHQLGHVAGPVREGDDEQRRHRAVQLRQLYADAHGPASAGGTGDHRQRRAADGRRRTGGDGDRAGHRQRDLQCGGRKGALAADHGGKGQGGDEGL